VFAFAFAQHNKPVDRSSGEDFVASVGPDYFQCVHALGLTQAKVCPRIIAAQITVHWINTAHQSATAGLGGNFGAVGVPMERGIEGADEQPLA